jgi:hypothetical protein
LYASDGAQVCQLVLKLHGAARGHREAARHRHKGVSKQAGTGDAVHEVRHARFELAKVGGGGGAQLGVHGRYLASGGLYRLGQLLLLLGVGALAEAAAQAFELALELCQRLGAAVAHLLQAALHLLLPVQHLAKALGGAVGSLGNVIAQGEAPGGRELSHQALHEG